MLNRSLLVDGVNEIFVVTTRISLVTFLLTIYCAKEFFSAINKEYFLKGTLTGFLAITIPGWTFIYALKSISSGLQSIFISTIPMFTVFWVFLVYKEEKITRLKVISVFIGLSGLILLFASGATGLSSDGDLVTGGLLALIGVQGLALSNITNKKDSQYIPARTYLLVQWLSSTAFSLILCFILGGEFEILNYSQAVWFPKKSKNGKQNGWYCETDVYYACIQESLSGQLWTTINTVAANLKPEIIKIN